MGPFLYTFVPMVSWVPGNNVSALIGAVSFFALDMKSIGFSGGGAEVGAKDGAASALSLGMFAALGRALAGLFEAPLPPFADTTATATAAPIPTVARAPPTIISSRRRLLRASEASASAAQSGELL
ncbi:hypothetical protein SY2F82_22650 [Streptomyces sp. Y2F8-2]|nr:hypothetical protein SY2F82_22650 [Streptomyces sp. Y2F8-2]